MEIVYQSKTYAPERVTGRYVRAHGSKRKGHSFRVFESETAQKGAFAGRPGMGCTLREYDVPPGVLPAEVEAKAVEAKHTILWDNPHT